MLKTTSLVSVLAFLDLLLSAQLVYSANFKTIPLHIAASMWYLLVTSVLSLGQFFIERHFNRAGITSRRSPRRPASPERPNPRTTPEEARP